MKNVGLVLEGGGMRGVYTGGVLEYFLEQQLFFPYVIGVSAGACNGASYVSRQKGRNQKVTIDLIDHPHYISYKSLLRKKELFGMDFIFIEVPNNLVPFDYETFRTVPNRFLVGTTDCHTGKPVYIDKNDCINEDISIVLKASSSLPFMAPTVNYQGMDLLDGGISDPIPIKKSIADGNTKNVVILTRNYGYRKKKSRFSWALGKFYKQYPHLIKTMQARHELYNTVLDFIEEQEKNGNIFVFRPTIPLKVRRVERDKTKLMELFNVGFNDAKRLHANVRSWLEAE